MAKKLVGEKGVEALVIDGNFYMDGTVILTPGAKDVLRDKKVPIVYGEKPEASAPAACAPAACEKDQLEAAVAAILKKEYGITDQAQVKALCAVVANLM